MKYFNQKVKFEKAEKICESNDAKLISIHSAEENEFIRSYVGKQPDYSTRVWIGLKRNISGILEFVWVDKSPFDYINWNTRPDNYGGFGPYIEMFIDRNGTWNDITNDNLVFVCGFNSKLLIRISKTVAFSYFIQHCMYESLSLTF